MTTDEGPEFSVLAISVGGHEASIPPGTARRLRDLLNLATMRGML